MAEASARTAITSASAFIKADPVNSLSWTTRPCRCASWEGAWARIPLGQASCPRAPETRGQGVRSPRHDGSGSFQAVLTSRPSDCASLSTARVPSKCWPADQGSVVPLDGLDKVGSARGEHCLRIATERLGDLYEHPDHAGTTSGMPDVRIARCCRSAADLDTRLRRLAGTNGMRPRSRPAAPRAGRNSGGPAPRQTRCRRPHIGSGFASQHPVDA
jgi:hypothetical protein